MFEALNHELAGDHRDFSFRDTVAWPRVGPDEQMPPSLWISLGDDVAGPAIQLIVTPPVPDNMWLDTHYHGSDQFRVQLQGGMQLQRRAMTAPQFGYQLAGIPYREGTLGGLSGDTWMFAVQGDRRGARSTKTRDDGTFLLPEVGDDQLDRFVDSADDPYWNSLPGGSKGISALSMTGMQVKGGFAWGSFDDADEWPELFGAVRATTALFGQAEVGPILSTLVLAPGTEIADVSALSTEIALAIAGGSCTIAGKDYRVGDVRVQRSDAALDTIVAGDDGLRLVLLVADRRALAESRNAGPLWQSLGDVLVSLQGRLELA